MKKLFWLSLGLLSFAAFAQDDNAQAVEATQTAVINDTAKTIEATQPVAQEKTTQTTATQSPQSQPSATERLAMEYFMRQMSGTTKEEPKEIQRSKFFLLSFKGGARVGESGNHFVQTIELGGYNLERKFMITGEGAWGNRIGGATANIGIIFPVVEDVFMIIPGFSGGLLVSTNEAYSSYNREKGKEIQDFAYSGAFVKLLFGNKKGKVYLDITNKVLMTKSNVDYYNYRDDYYYGYYSYYDSDEKFGVSYIGTFGITLLL